MSFIVDYRKEIAEIMQEDMIAGKGQRQSQVAQQVELLEKGLARTHELIDQLNTRIGSVLREPNPPLVDADKKEEENPVVPFVAQLRENRRYLDKANKRLSDILDRIEL